MARSSIIVSLVFVIVFTSAVQCKTTRVSVENNRRGNSIPRPKLEAFYPRGLKVSMPDIPGMELFAFHGKVNSPIIELEGGNLSKDVHHSVNGEWIFEDPDVQLRIGDVVNYWVFVQINRMGHRLDNLSTVIRELVPVRRTETTHTAQTSSTQLTQHGLSLGESGGSTECHNNQNSRPETPSTTGCGCDLSELKTISTQLNITLTQLSLLNDVVVPLRSQVESLTELLQELTKDKNIGTQLLLIGLEPPGRNPLEAIRQLIVEKLELIDLDQKIQQAHKTREGILFEVSSPIDKKRILFRAEKRLYNSNYYILDPQGDSVDTKRNYQSYTPFIPTSMVRMAGETSLKESMENHNVESYDVENMPLRPPNRSKSTTQSSRRYSESAERHQTGSRNQVDNNRRIVSNNESNNYRRTEDTYPQSNRESSTPEYDEFTERTNNRRNQITIANGRRKQSSSGQENYQHQNNPTG